MDMITELRRLGFFEARIPRYTSYPTAPVFSPTIGSGFQGEQLSKLDPAVPVSVYVHVPFCERLCWFCACRTQGTKTLAPVQAYINTLHNELKALATQLPDGIKMGQLHWGGGTPTILSPALITELMAAITAVFPPAETFEFSVETDPTMVDGDKIMALSQAGMTRASIGIQDFNPRVQAAIGREQSFEQTADCVDMLRAAGIESLNTDIVYGLPYQTRAGILASLKQVLRLNPDRVALFGYAHVPWMAKRQRLIDEPALPGDVARFTLFEAVSDALVEGGFDTVGIDHFARPEDELSKALHAGHLRRNFQGYTSDRCPTLIGVGASAISKFPGGYVQNAPATAAYAARIETGGLAGSRGHRLSADDMLHATVIERLMCDFAVDFSALERAPFELLHMTEIAADCARTFAPHVTWDGNWLRLDPQMRMLARLVAHRFDDYANVGARYSRVS